MGMPLKLLLIFVSGTAIVAGQAFMTVYIRKFPAVFSVNKAVSYSLTSWTFYGFFISYGLALLTNLILLRFFPLAQVTVSILVVSIVTGVVCTFFLGQSLTWPQLAGVLMILIGFVFLNAR